MAEFNITIVHATDGNETVVAVEPEFTIGSIMDVLSENLEIANRIVLATESNKILSPELTVAEVGLRDGDKLVMMPDPTGGR